MAETPPTALVETPRELLFVALFFTAVSVTLCLADRSSIHLDSAGAETEFESVLSSFAEQKVDGPFAYRVLVPYLEWWLVQYSSISPLTIDFFLKALTLAACQWIFWLYLRRFFGRIESLLGVFILDLFIMASLSTVVGQWPSETAEILNILTFALVLYLANDGRYLLLLPVLFVGTFNRETTWLLLPLIAATSRKPAWVLCAVAAVIIPYSFLRLMIESPKPLWWTTDALARNIPLLSPTTTANGFVANIRLIFMLGPFLLAGAFGFRDHPRFLRLTSWIIPSYFIAHYVFGNIIEIRLWVPLLVVLVPLALSGLHALEVRKH